MIGMTNLQKSQPLGSGPDAGGVVAVTADLLWFRLVSQAAPLGGVNIWALRDDAGWAVVDTGFADAETTAQWDVILNHLDGPITRIICTHFHPDHIGQVGNLLRRFDMPLIMTEVEWSSAWQMADPPQGYAELYAAHLRRLGLSPEAAAQLTNRPRAGLTSGLPDTCLFMRAGDTLPLAGGDWTVSIGAGHSPAPGILTNRKDKLMIVGDQLLMRITPHVGIQATEPDADPLGEYLHYLAEAETIDPDTLILPGHGPAFLSGGARARDIADHHRERLDVLRSALGKPTLAVNMVEVLFGRPLKGVSLMLGLSEAEAHLQHLVRTNQARVDVDDERRFFYSAI